MAHRRLPDPGADQAVFARDQAVGVCDVSRSSRLSSPALAARRAYG
jgi:hypothetical protein